MDRPHWRIRNVRDFALFFRALPILAQEGAHLALAEGVWPPEVRAFLTRTSVDLGEGVRERLAREFATAFCLDVSGANMAALADFADCHAEPEIAGHIAVLTAEGPFLEWFDVPDDPIAASSSIAEDLVSRFSREVGGTCEMCDGV